MESHVTMNMQPEKTQRLKKAMTDLNALYAVKECKNYFKEFVWVCILWCPESIHQVAQGIHEPLISNDEL